MLINPSNGFRLPLLSEHAGNQISNHLLPLLLLLLLLELGCFGAARLASLVGLQPDHRLLVHQSRLASARSLATCTCSGLRIRRCIKLLLQAPTHLLRARRRLV